MLTEECDQFVRLSSTGRRMARVVAATTLALQLRTSQTLRSATSPVSARRQRWRSTSATMEVDCEPRLRSIDVYSMQPVRILVFVTSYTPTDSLMPLSSGRHSAVGPRV